MGEQFDLFDWVLDLNTKRKPEERKEMHAIDSWSYGVVELENGDLFLAEIYWDADDRPLMYCEPHLTVDPEEGVKGLIHTLENALKDLTAEPYAIPVSAFYTNEDNE